MKFERITINPDQMSGMPCIRGSRIPVATVVGMVADGTERRSSGHSPIWNNRTSVRPCARPAEAKGFGTASPRAGRYRVDL